LDKAESLLQEIESEGLFTTIEMGKFGGVKRPRNGGKGLDGVTTRDAKYYNPFIQLILGGEK